MGKLSDGLKKIRYILINSLKRFPETIGISTILVVVLIVNNRTDWDYRDVLEHIALIAALGIPISASWVLLHERLGLSSIWRILGGVGLLVYGVLSYLFKPVEIDEYYMIRYAFASAIFYFIFTLLPYFWHRKGYGKYCVRILTSFLTTYLYTLVLYLGVIAIIFTIDLLFNLNLSEEWYFDIFAISTGIFGLTYFLGQVPKVEDDLSAYQYPKILQVLLTAIVMPLLGLYTLVLYAYLVRILVSVGWEDGFVSQLVIWYGFISLAIMVLVHPVKDNNRFVIQYYRYYPYSMIVPLIMLGISIGIRINAYGLTVMRGLVLLALIWFVYGVVIRLLPKKLNVQWIVIGFIAIFGVALLSPLNIINISLSQQEARLTEELENLNMLEGNQIIPRKDLTDESMRGISSIVDFIGDYRGYDKVAYLPKDFDTSDMEEVFGFGYMNQYYYQNEYGRTFINYYQEDQVVNISGYEYHLPLTTRMNESEAIDGEVFASATDEAIQVYIDGVKVLDERVIDLITEAGHDQTLLRGNQDVMISTTSQVSGGSVMIVFTNINGYEEDDQLVIDYFNADVYIAID